MICTLHFKVHEYTGTHVTSLSQAFDRFVDMICTLHFKVHGYTGTHVTSLSQAFERLVCYLHVLEMFLFKLSS